MKDACIFTPNTAQKKVGFSGEIPKYVSSVVPWMISQRKYFSLLLDVFV
jgi:hypothetical protein